jgi:hypothetical protein
MKNTTNEEGEKEKHLPVAETARHGSERGEREDTRWMARKGEVTLASSRHLPPAETAQRARMREHRASQARIKRPIWPFLGSLAEVEGEVLHALSLAETIDQTTKHLNTCALHLGSLVDGDAPSKFSPIIFFELLLSSCA